MLEPLLAVPYWTLADLQNLVLQVEAVGGGWMMISMHGLCGGTESCRSEWTPPYPMRPPVRGSTTRSRARRTPPDS